MIDKLLYRFFAWIDSLVQKVTDVCTFDIGEKLPKKKEKLENVNIVIVSVIVKMICIYMRIKIYALATTVNVNNYANFQTL